MHTPASIVNNYKAGDDCEKWENFIRDLEHLPKDVKVLGINDYLFVDGYKKVLEYKKSGRLKNIDLLLPVVEFRLAQFAGNEQFKRINFHVIFSDQVDADVIQSQFLNALSSKYQLSPEHNGMTWGGVITMESLRDLGRIIIDSVPETEKKNYGSELVEGFNNLNLDYRVIIKILQDAPQYFEKKYFTAIGKTEWDAIRWNDGSIADKKNIINCVDFVFTAAETVDNYYSGLEALTRSGVNNRLLDCSDAHSNLSSSNKDRIGNCHCWIKAETTFEGLRQVLFEPDERKAVSLINPQQKNSYQIIDRVELDEPGFWHDEILFNPNLNTIIGGRATGKSTLIKAVAAKQANVVLKEEDCFVRNHLDGVKVIWADGAEHPDNQIDFFQQSYMHDLAENEDAFNMVLKTIISDKDDRHLLSDYENANNRLRSQLTHDILAIFQNRAIINSTLEKISSKGNKAAIVAGISGLKAKLLELSKGAAMSEDDLKQYQMLSDRIVAKEQYIAKGNHDLALFTNNKDSVVVNRDYLRLSGLDDLEFGDNVSEVRATYEEISTRTNFEWNTYIKQRAKIVQTAIDQLKTAIIQTKESEVYKKGQKFYADNKEIGDLKAKIQEEEKKVLEIEQLERDLSQLKAEESRLFSIIVSNHLQYLTNTQNVEDNLHFETDGLVISAKRRMKKEDFYGFLDNAFNVRSGERQEYLRWLKECYELNTEETIRDFLNKALANEITLKNYNEIQQVATRLLSDNWFTIDFELLYQNDTFKQMSSGKQAFVVLKLLLDFSDKKNPILIDQPEDSLDNRAIYKELVTYIKRKKRDRQIILVTHNPNVVVSSDSENVIVANQQGNDSKNDNGCRFQYVNGALETTKKKEDDCEFVLKSQGIREHVCEILEGGESAFVKREQKYGLVH